MLDGAAAPPGGDCVTKYISAPRAATMPSAYPRKFCAIFGAVFAMLPVLCAGSGSAPAPAVSSNVDWPVYLGDRARTLYSPLDQINRDNVGQLEIAWTYDTGEAGEYQSNNLIIAGVLYTATPTRKVIALDAATGREIWQWDPAIGRGAGARRQRGLVFWQNEDGGEQRIFTGARNYLYALDPKTGRPIRTFGDNGSIHLGQGLDEEAPPNVTLNTPGVIHRDLLIFGISSNSPRGIRAMDVRTGRIRWQFDTVPRPGDIGYETWPAGFDRTNRSANDWSGQALDEQRGIVYASTRSSTPDFYGGDRHGMNLFANSIVALDAATGRRLWHYQIVHHDVLDKDLPCPPVLLTVTHDGKKVDAVAQGTKHGLLFVFDRVTGAPLWPVEEKPVPQSNLEGEELWPTQPFPTMPAPLMRQHYGEEDASTVSPEAHALTLQRIRQSPNFGPFPAPSLDESIMFPGFDGGMEWGGGAVDPDGIYYVNINEIPWLLRMVETRRPDGTPLSPGERDYLLDCAACHGLDRAGNPAAGFPSLVDIGGRKTREEVSQITRQGVGRMPAFDRIPDARREAVLDYLFGTVSRSEDHGSPRPPPGNTQRYAFAGFRRWTDLEGYPAIKPPWGTLNAVDLNTGELKWKVTLGEYRELTARGIPPTGTENYGGPVVTAGGLIFIAATADETIRAFDRETGATLWEAALPFGGNATPSTYMIDGRQYLVISAGGTKSNRPSGGTLVAFALRQIP
jgi:quinoprotein glucose dehydrogenase